MKTCHSLSLFSEVQTLLLAAIKAQMWFPPTQAEATAAPVQHSLMIIWHLLTSTGAR